MIEVRAYIESGILELYVFGTLSQADAQEVAQMAAKQPEIQEEIISIEKAVISLSYSMAPYLSAANFDRIRESLIEKHGKVVDLKPKSNFPLVAGWAAAVLLLIGITWQYTLIDTAKNEVANMETEKDTLKLELNDLKLTQKQTESLLAIVRDQNNTVVPLGGQTISPESKAKVYWNQSTQTVYVDAAGLPEPPAGFVYQVWTLKLDPLTPTSIGLLDDFIENKSRLFAVNNATEAEAFAITLEPVGGSPSPNLEQLYTLGKVL
jgi:anti-sigma-K factor RskA